MGKLSEIQGELWRWAIKGLYRPHDWDQGELIFTKLDKSGKNEIYILSLIKNF